MTEINEVVPEVQQEEVIDYKALYEKAQKDIEKIAAKKDELLNETKKAKADREAAEQAAIQAAKEKAIKDGEFENLWKTAQKEKEELETKLKEFAANNRKEKVQITSMRIANDLADGDNAELLSEFIQRNVDKIANEHGEVEASVLEALKTEFKNNNKYQSLLRGSKAQGGGATGNMRGAQQKSQISQSDFKGLSAMEQINALNKISAGQLEII